MKRLLAILLLIVSFNSFAQNTLTRPSGTTFQQMGSSATWLQQNGIGYAVVGFVNSNYDDTTAANGNQFAKQTAGTQIYTTSGGGKLWIRNSTATRWLEISTGSSTTNSNVGSGFRLAIPGTNDIKTAFFPYSVKADSTSNTNALTLYLENDTTASPANYFYGRNSAGRRGWYPQSGIPVRFGVSGEDASATGNRAFNFDNNQLSFEAISSFNITAGLSASGPVDINWTELRDVTMTTTGVGGGDFNFSSITADKASRILMSQDSIIFVQECLSGCGDADGGYYLFPNVNYNVADIGLNRLAGFASNNGRLGGFFIGSGLSISNDSIVASGATPTFQQVLTAGSTLTGNNTIDGGGGTNQLQFTNNSKFLAASGSGSFDVNDINAWAKVDYGNSDLTLKTDSAGLTVANQLRVYIGNSKFWINPFNQDNDFIVETTNDTAAIFVDAGNDRVGIGTATPSTKLHVNGGFRLVDGTQQSGYVLTSDANGVGTWQAAAGGGGTPAGNFGNLQINRNGAFATPASDSLTFLSTGFTSVAGAFSLTGGGARVYGNDAFGGAILRYGAGDAHAVTIQVGTITLSTNFNTRLQLVDASTTVSNRFRQTQGADVASAAGAIALGSDGNSFEITGTAAITLISNVGWQNGSKVTLLFTSTATLTDGTANSGTDIGMELAGNTNFTGSAGATITLLLSEIGGVQRYREVARSVN
jgi:hypothetical protein